MSNNDKKMRKEVIKKVLTEILRGSFKMIDKDIDKQLGMEHPFAIIAHVMEVYVDKLDKKLQELDQKTLEKMMKDEPEQPVKDNVIAFNKPKKNTTIH